MSTTPARRSIPRVSAIAVTLALLAAPAAEAAGERFRLAAGSVMQHDDAGVDGTIGYAQGFGYEVVQGYAIAEGDIVLGRVDASGRLEVPFLSRGLGARGFLYRWPDGILPYAFHPGLSEIQQRNVEEALERIASRTRILPVPADSPEAAGYADYVLFEPSEGCGSFVGRQLQQDSQSLWVADSCSVGSIVHEIAHAIGLFHEHSRPDRDNYISVVRDEILDSKQFNFDIYEDGTENWGTYDYGSIMHYGERYFSKRGERTIIAPEHVDIGQRVQLSEGDIEAIDRMYATDLAVDATMHESERGLEIDVSVSNNGDLGARGLTLRLLGRVGTDWLSVSADSGWDCLAHEEELRCERTRLIEQASSRFTLVADPATADAEDIVYRLDSVTLDTDPGNNGAADGVFGDAESLPAPLPTPAAAMPTDPDDAEPSAASPSTRSTTGALEQSDGGGGGAAGLAALALIVPFVVRRRRRSA